MSRFPQLPAGGQGRFANFQDRLDAPLPGETMASTDPKYAKRDPAFRPQVPVAPKAKASAPAVPAKSTAMIMAEAAERGRRDAQARYKNVMSSKAVVGREKQAQELLLASCEKNAKFPDSTAIIAELQIRDPDAQHYSSKPAPTAKASSDAAKVWERAYGIAPAPEADAGNVWDRAYAKVAAARGKTMLANAETQPEQSAESVWDRAYAKLGKAKA